MFVAPCAVKVILFASCALTAGASVFSARQPSVVSRTPALARSLAISRLPSQIPTPTPDKAIQGVGIGVGGVLPPEARGSAPDPDPYPWHSFQGLRPVPPILSKKKTGEPHINPIFVGKK